MSAIIRKALEEVAYDNGMVNRIDGEPDWRLPPHWRDHEQQIDAELSALSPEDFETLCIGEDADMRAVAERAPLAHRMLNDFFDGDWSVSGGNSNG